MHSGWPDRDRLLRKKWEGIEMMSIKSLYEISEITVWRKGMIVFSWRSPSSPSSELSGKNGEDKVTGKRDGVIRELKKHEHGRLVKSYKPCSRSTRSWTFAYRRCMTNDVKLSDFAFMEDLHCSQVAWRADTCRYAALMYFGLLGARPKIGCKHEYNHYIKSQI